MVLQQPVSPSINPLFSGEGGVHTPGTEKIGRTRPSKSLKRTAPAARTPAEDSVPTTPNTPTRRRAYTSDVSARVYSFLAERPNRGVKMESIVRGTGLEPRQIRAAARHLAEKGTAKIESLLRGGVFILHERADTEATQAAPVKSEVGLPNTVGKLSDGTTILELPDGSVWLATRVR